MDLRRAARRRTVARSVPVLAVVAAVAALAPAARADEWTARTGLRVDAYTGAGQDGHQVLAPIGLAFDTPSWGLDVRGAFGNSERDPGTAPRGSLTGFTDTTLSGYYRLTVAGTELRAGLGLDLPTGVSRLKTAQLATLQSEDLVTLRRFGEGLDVNPTLTAYRNFGVFGLGLGVGYLWNEEYDPSTQPNDDLDPGDELTVSALADLYATDTIRVLLRVAYTYYTPDERRGQEVFREGDQFDVRLTTEWRPEPWWAVLTLRNIVRLDAERVNPASRLVPEEHNSHGNEFRAGLTVGYILSDAWGIQGGVELLHVSSNDFPRGDPLRDGGRTKVAVGPGVTWTPSRLFGVEAGVRYFVMDVEQGPFFPRAGTIHGIHASVLVTYRF
jgi:hypothetical protein